MTDFYYVTGNTQKFYEASCFFSTYAPFITLKQCDKDLVEIQSLDQQQIAIHKALQAWDILQKPLLVDDAGIYFDKYHQFPGTLTKFLYKGIGLNNILKLIEHHERVTVRLQVVCVYAPDQYCTFEGLVQGMLRFPADKNVPPMLPYDAIFVPDGSDKTYEQMRKSDPAQWHFYNYRFRALQKFLQWYQQYTAQSNKLSTAQTLSRQDPK